MTTLRGTILLFCDQLTSQLHLNCSDNKFACDKPVPRESLSKVSRKNAPRPAQSFRIPAYSIRLWLPTLPAIIYALRGIASSWQIKFFWNPRVSPSKIIVKKIQRYIEEQKCRSAVILDMKSTIFSNPCIKAFSDKSTGKRNMFINL